VSLGYIESGGESRLLLTEGTMQQFNEAVRKRMRPIKEIYLLNRSDTISSQIRPVCGDV
jgi:hypothetical protein